MYRGLILIPGRTSYGSGINSKQDNVSGISETTSRQYNISSPKVSPGCFIRIQWHIVSNVADKYKAYELRFSLDQ